MGENVIEDGRGRNENRFPVSFSERKCARIARNSISHAFIIENANEMQFHAVPDTFPSRNANEMRESPFSSRISSRKCIKKCSPQTFPAEMSRISGQKTRPRPPSSPTELKAAWGPWLPAARTHLDPLMNSQEEL